MTEAPANSPPPQVEPPAGPDSAPPPDESRSSRRHRKRWSWKRWLANLMILAGVLILPGYFLGTCACTALHQNQLRQDLQAGNPQLASADAALAGTDFTSAVAIDLSVSPEEAAAAAALAAAEAERLEQLALFKAAADAFEASTAGGDPLGRILIPSIGVDVVMVEGTGKGDLKEGPGHWPETPFPGQGGNFVVSGHRTTYGAPFFKLNEVQVGDEIDLVLPYALARYKVTRVIIVYPDEVDTVAQLGKEQVSLAACHPIYSAKQRIVVQGDLTSFKLLEPQG